MVFYFNAILKTIFQAEALVLGLKLLPAVIGESGLFEVNFQHFYKLHHATVYVDESRSPCQQIVWCCLTFKVLFLSLEKKV